MRRFSPLLVLAACATMTAPDLQHVRGCWIERRSANETLTIRFPPLLARPGVRVGDVLTYHGGVGGTERDGFELREERRGFLYCPLDLGTPHGPPCQPAVVGGGLPPPDAGTWVRITATDRRLRIAIEDGRTSSPIFDGARDGCD